MTNQDEKTELPVPAPDEERAGSELEASEREDRWVKNFINHLAGGDFRD